MYTAIVQKEGDWWIGFIRDVPGVNCQEKTRDELIDSLRMALKDILDYNREQLASIVTNPNYQEVSIQL